MCGSLVFQPLKWFHNPLMGHDPQLKKHDVRHDFGGIKQKSDASAFINKLDFYSGKMRTQKIPIRRCLWLYTFNLGIFPVTSKDARARVKPSQHLPPPDRILRLKGVSKLEIFQFPTLTQIKTSGNKCSYQNFSRPWKQAYNVTSVTVLGHEEK